jgi:hypothetical protein
VQFFHSTIIYSVFPWFMCPRNFLAMFCISTKSCLISISFFPINTMSSAYANVLNYCLPIFISLGIIFVLCITFCNAKLNIGDNWYKLFVSFLHTPACICRDAGGQERESYWRFI